MANEEIVPANPVSWALSVSEQFLDQGEEKLAQHLVYGAIQFGFPDQQYLVETSSALAVPESFEANEPILAIELASLTFEGTFKSYKKIGEPLAEKSLRVIYLAFDDALLLPDFDTFPEDRLLCVRADAVGYINKTI